MRWFALFLLVPCAALADTDPAILGTWEGTHNTGVPFWLDVHASGQCAMYGEAGRCSASGGKLAFKNAVLDETYTYVLSGERMTLTGGDLDDETLHLVRKGSEPVPAVAKETAKKTVVIALAPKAVSSAGPSLAGDYRVEGSRDGFTLCTDGRLLLAGAPAGLISGTGLQGRWTATGAQRGTLDFTNEAGASTRHEFALSGQGDAAKLNLGQRVFRKSGDARCP